MKNNIAITNKLLAAAKSLGAITLASVLLLSCDLSKETIEPGLTAEDLEDNELVQMDVVEDSYFEDTDNLAIEALDSELSNSGKAATDDRLAGATVTRTGNDEEGTIRVDFGGGVTDGRGRTRKGSIMYEYRGRLAQSGSSWKVTFDDFSIDGVELEGSRTLTTSVVSGDVTTFEIRLEDGRATFPDGRIARRRLHRWSEHHRNNNILDRLIIYGTEEGNCRNGRGFIIDITEPLIYDRSCNEFGVFIPVQGVKVIKHGARQITIDYGDGRCDNVVTITNKNGRSWEYKVVQ